MRGAELLAVHLLACCLALSCFSDNAAARTLQAGQKLEEVVQQKELVFFVIGDWGRQGSADQRAVAAAMASQASKTPPAFIVNVGDNFYPDGLRSVDDVQFNKSFTSVYNQTELLKTPWYSVLGNHDYGDGNYNPLNYLSSKRGACSACQMQLSKRDARWFLDRWYSRTVSGPFGRVGFFFYDTSPYIGYYPVLPWYHSGDLGDQSADANTNFLKAALSNSSDLTWKFVVGHHPVYSNAGHGDSVELIREIEPLLKRNGVQAYFNGHEHSLELIHNPNEPTWYVTSGAGSSPSPEFPNDSRARMSASKFQYGQSGFVRVRVSASETVLDFFGTRIQPGGAPPLFTQRISRT